MEKVLENIASDGISRVRFSGGEPLLRNDLPQLVSFAKNLGLFISLNTNASLLSKESPSTEAYLRDRVGPLGNVIVTSM